MDGEGEPEPEPEEESEHCHDLASGLLVPSEADEETARPRALMEPRSLDSSKFLGSCRPGGGS